MSRAPVAVVKIGGSLARTDQLGRWLAAAVAAPPRVAVVPGGGPLADQVRDLQRQLGFPDGLAHRLAIVAMEQFGRILAALQPALVPAGSRSAIGRAWAAGRVPVWLPWRMVAGRPEIPESWEVTSDSLAAWLAGQLDAARLVLVKSTRPAVAEASLAQLVGSGLVDPQLPRFLAAAGCAAWCLGADEAGVLAQVLGPAPAAGTRLLPDAAAASC